MEQQRPEKHTRSLVETILRQDSEGRAAMESTGDLQAAVKVIDLDKISGKFVERIRNLPADEVTEPAAARNAAELVSRKLNSGLIKAGADHHNAISDSERMAMEAVVLADGSRPSLLLRAGATQKGHPMAGQWEEFFRGLEGEIKDHAAAVCRIEPTHGSAGSYFGTGFLVDKDKGLVLTNQHVLEQLLWSASTLAERKKDLYRIYDGVFVDFLGEVSVQERHRFKVVEAYPTPVEGPGLARFDAAVLKIEPINSSPELPRPITVAVQSDDAGGSLASFCVIGFPGPPRWAFGIHDGVDFRWVHRQLFGGRFGLKRIAPGKIHIATGRVKQDPKGWVFGHNATSLGGNSGSPTIAWLDGGHAFGLHFAGYTNKENHAHSAFHAKDELQRLGIPIVT